MPQSKPGFTFLVCPDSQLLRTYLREQLAAFPPASGQWERHVYWGDEEPPPRFWEQLALPGLFGTARALVVRQAQLWPAAVWKNVSQALGRPSTQCWPFFCLEVNWEKGQPKIPAHIAKLRCMGFADRQGWIWRHEGLTERGIKRHVQQRAAALQLSFEPDALEQFCAAVPPDALAIENELQKLTLLRNAGGVRSPEDTATGNAPALKTITTAMTSTGSWSPECNIFACIRHMEAGNLAAVWKELARSRDNDSLLFSLLALLAREMRLLWQTWAGEKVRLHPSEAGFKRQLALRLGPRGLAESMAAIMDAEWQVKSGRRTPEQSLEFLAARLTCLFAGQPRA
ncbi:DNA polymerase III subunit delta [Desulfovibrio sp. ZJ200]|uniref:DNA polymerase III subunit delta n=1 Tax=Desulfovibrio sp. ZJ200 TaxID=2709792 RepID=UPI0013EE1049|nr:DNA polymerase III subunit delta [Desulfovibrio sp. ZJ200]